jgi:hypothetical protein
MLKHGRGKCNLSDLFEVAPQIKTNSAFSGPFRPVEHRTATLLQTFRVAESRGHDVQVQERQGLLGLPAVPRRAANHCPCCEPYREVRRGHLSRRSVPEYYGGIARPIFGHCKFVNIRTPPHSPTHPVLRLHPISLSVCLCCEVAQTPSDNANTLRGLFFTSSI